MNGLPKPAYVLSGPHLSGHRVILGYETLTDAQNAHAALAHPPAQSSETGGEMALKPDFLRALPGGAMDDTTFQDVEDALDRAGAPCRADGDTGRWLTLAERVAALSAPQAAPGEGEQS